MKVTLKNYTPDALNLLLSTKNTRLKFSKPVDEWTDQEKKDHLGYMLQTIKSSWEFVDYVFLIEDVTRAFTHQLVRTRTASYAQQAQRAVNVSDQPVLKPSFKNPESEDIWDRSVASLMDGYNCLINECHEATQDARGLLPTNITTSIMMKVNLRTLHETGKLRLCTRAQGEYQQVFREMRQRVIEVHPWTEDFINVHCVAEGTCAFPRYGKEECPIYDKSLDQSDVKIKMKEKWNDMEFYESSPEAKDGMAS